MDLLQDSTTVKFRHFESNRSEESPVLGVQAFMSGEKLILPLFRSSYTTTSMF